MKPKTWNQLFGTFWVFHPVGKQAYMLELLARWRIYDMFYMLLLEKENKKKGRKFSVPEFEPGDNNKYEVEVIWDNAVYAKKADRHLPGLYYLVA